VNTLTPIIIKSHSSVCHTVAQLYQHGSDITDELMLLAIQEYEDCVKEKNKQNYELMYSDTL
jgi:hypothetical protein